MNILVLGAFDSMNAVLAPVILELKGHGHHCTVIVKNQADFVNNRIFESNRISIAALSECDGKMLEETDMVLAAPVLPGAYDSLLERIYERKLFIIVFATLFSSVAVRICPHLVFAIGRDKVDELRREGLYYNTVCVGNPQYDKAVLGRKSAVAEPHNILIIEQGAYPYGKRGKRAEADVFMHLARSNPDKEFFIKARYARKSVRYQLHQLSEHIYDYLERDVENLHFLEESEDLDTIIHRYDAVITTWSTAYLTAAVAEKPLLLIEGLPSVDVYNVRNERIDEAYEILRESGCVMDYRELYHRPLTFRTVKEEFLKKQVYRPKSPSAAEIVRIMEQIKAEIIDKRQYILTVFDTDAGKLEELLPTLLTVSRESETAECTAEARRKTNEILQRFVYYNRCLAHKLDTAALLAYLRETYDGVYQSRREVRAHLDTLRKLIDDAKNAYFRKYEALRDPKGQGPIEEEAYFRWLYQRREFKKLLSQKESSCMEALHYYQANALLARGRWGKAADCFAEYLTDAAGRECPQVELDTDLTKYMWKGSWGKYLMLLLLLKKKNYEAIEKVDPKENLYNNKIIRNVHAYARKQIDKR